MTVATFTTGDGTTYPCYTVSWEADSTGYTVLVSPSTGILLDDEYTYPNPALTTAQLTVLEDALTTWAATLSSGNVQKLDVPAQSQLYP